MTVAPTASKSRRVLLITAAGAALLTGGGYAWHVQHQRAVVRAALPETPALESGLAALDAALQEQSRAAFRGDRRAIAELGHLYHANGLTAEAETCWSFLVEGGDEDPRWHYYLADLRRLESDTERMAEHLQRVVQLDPAYTPAWLQLANQAFKTGRLEEAEEQYRRRLSLLPGDPYATLGLARIALQRSTASEARQLIESLVQDHPQFSPGQNIYAEMLAGDGAADQARWHRWLGREAGRYREPDDPWLQELNERCLDPERLGVLGTIEYQMGRLDLSKRYLERALDLAPNSPPAYERLGDLYLRQGQLDLAAETFRKGLQVAPIPETPVSLYISLCETLRRLGRADEALRVADEAVSQRGASHELQGARGVALSDLGRDAEAVAAFRLFLESRPTDPDMNFNLAVSLLPLERRDEALAALRSALALQPTFPKALSLMAELELEAGRVEAAGPFARALYDSYPGMEDARQLWAEWNLRAGRAAESRHEGDAATNHYQEGLKALPQHPGLLGTFGVHLLNSGRLQDALNLLQDYRRFRPDDPAGSLYLGEAYARLGRTEDARKTLTQGIELAQRTSNTVVARRCQEILERL